MMMMMKTAYILAAVLLLLSCRSTESTESTSESRRLTETALRLDSIMRSHSVLQQQLLVSQSSLTDRLSERERSDSSYSVVVNEQGDTVRERIVINKQLEHRHDTDRSELLMLAERFRETDSLVRMALDRQAVTDSLLREHDRVTVVKQEPSLWQRIRRNAGYAATAAVSVSASILMIRLYTRLRRKASLKS